MSHILKRPFLLQNTKTPWFPDFSCWGTRAFSLEPLNEHIYLNFAERRLLEPKTEGSQRSSFTGRNARQAVRSLGRLRFSCYQPCTRRLSTRCSSWDLDFPKKVGKVVLGAASRLDAFSAYPF